MSEPSKPVFFTDEFISIQNYLNAAQEVLSNGYMPDITSLEKRVAHLCEALQKAEKEVQAEALPRLKELLNNLDRCEKAMRAFQIASQKVESMHDKP